MSEPRGASQPGTWVYPSVLLCACAVGVCWLRGRQLASRALRGYAQLGESEGGAHDRLGLDGLPPPPGRGSRQGSRRNSRSGGLGGDSWGREWDAEDAVEGAADVGWGDAGSWGWDDEKDGDESWGSSVTPSTLAPRGGQQGACADDEAHEHSLRPTEERLIDV